MMIPLQNPERRFIKKGKIVSTGQKVPPNGEIWKFEEELTKLLKLTSEVLSDEPLFLLLNS